MVNNYFDDNNLRPFFIRKKQREVREADIRGSERFKEGVGNHSAGIGSKAGRCRGDRLSVGA